MRKFRFWFSVITLILLLIPAGSVLAQTYSFQLPKQVVNYYVNPDGTASADIVLVFTNDLTASPIDFVDVGLPNNSFRESSITAEVNGVPVSDISSSGYQGSGTGVAIGLGANAIQPGQTGQVRVRVGQIGKVLYPDSSDANYASIVYSPTWFGEQYVHGPSNLTVAFHLPPGVKPEEPRWHKAPSGFPAEPQTSLDENGNVVYSWTNPDASASKQYTFGASFPSGYVPNSAIQRPDFFQSLGIDPDTCWGLFWCFGILGLILGSSFFSVKSAQKRKLQYLPPKIAIEGHGIKRGLTAIEAAILLEQPLDKILTMILFSTIKKDAATVVKRDPLEIKASHPLPEGLFAYETQFLSAMEKDEKNRRKAMQEMMIDLVQSVAQKMKGFSRRETQEYYRGIIQRAWQEVEKAETPEVKSQRFDEVMEWTMLDKHYEDRTRDVFRSGPVYVPHWWGRYDPVYRPSTPTSTPSSSGGGASISLPQLPGSSFAASVVLGTQQMAGSVIGNITDFTSSITQKTNPVPVSTSSGRSGGGGGCACACAGCACACAGGGR